MVVVVAEARELAWGFSEGGSVPVGAEMPGTTVSWTLHWGESERERFLS